MTEISAKQENKRIVLCNDCCSATISTEGASLDALSVNGLNLVQRFALGSARPMSAGFVLAPWPNRIRGGKWSDSTHDHQLEITEPLRGNAIHGLVTHTDFDVAAHNDSSVTLTTTISPAPGYPYQLTLSVIYALSDSGITCAMKVSNIGNTRAPVALGAHPYLCIGDASARSLSISAPVVSHLMTDEQMIPTDEVPVAGTAFDIRTPTPLSGLQLDTGFRLGGDKGFATTLSSPDGLSVSLWQGPEFSWLQVFVTDEFPGPDGPTSAVAIEPMTAPADAFNSRVDLTWLSPQEEWGGSWGITLGC